MTKTENYQLNQWEPTDPINREDFNADNATIDAALASKASTADLSALQTQVSTKGNCKIAVGSYVGAGAYGESAPNSLTFDFVPQVVMVMPVASTFETAVMLQGSTLTTMGGSTSVLSWSGNSVSWYNEWNGTDCQFNTAGVKYLYMALG